MPANQGTFLPEVGAVAGDHYLLGEVALTPFAGETVDTTVTGTEVTRPKYLLSPGYPGAELSAAVKRFVSGYLPYSSVSVSLFPFLIISTVGGDVRIVSVEIFLADFLVFFGSLCR